MSELVAWLETQLADDEAVARAALESAARAVRYHNAISDALPFPVTPRESARMVEAAMRVSDSEHDPARVLAEVEAWRKIIALHEDVDYGTFEGVGAVSMCKECRDQRGPCPTLRALATVFADRPGYDPRWAL